MQFIKSKALKIIVVYGFIFFLQACSTTEDTNPPPEKGTLETNQEVATFVESYYASLAKGTAQRASGPPLQMSVRIGPSGDPDLCSTGELYGPYTVSGDIIEGGGNVTASQPSIRLANQGELGVCMIVTSPVDASLDIETNSVFVEASECDQSPAYIGGVWEGDYSCTSSCGNESGSVQLTILQDGYTATYDDGDAFYEGNVCGNTFKYSGGTDNYTEGGTFTLNSNGTASKTSNYESTVDDCSGSCNDPVLTRISEQVLLDDFEDTNLDPEYLVVTDNTLNDVAGWTFDISNSQLIVTDVTPDIINTGNGGTISRLLLNRTFSALSDFLVEFEFSWESDNVSAMQYFDVQLHPDVSGPRIAYAGYADGWVSGNGQQSSGIASETYVSGINTLPENGSASVKIKREGVNVEVIWNGTVIQSHESTGNLGRIFISFSHYPYDNGLGAVSSFGTISLNSIRISGTLAQ